MNSILISVWAILITAAVFALQQNDEKAPVEPEDSVAELVDRRTDTISTAIFENGNVIGHLATRVHFQLRDGAETSISVPLDLIIEDGLFEITFNMTSEELLKLEQKNLNSLAKKLEQTLNQRKTPLAVENLRFENTRLMLKSS